MENDPQHKVYSFDDFRIDASHRMLYRRDEEIPMVPKAVETLLALIERRGKIVSKDELLAAVWPDTVVEESNLFLYLSLLRKTLGTQKDGKPYVETLRRRGYRFNGEVHLVRQEVESELDASAEDRFVQSRAKTIAKSGEIYFVKDWGRKTESRENSAASAAAPALKPIESPSNLMTAENESGLDELSPVAEIAERPLDDSGVASAEPPRKAEHPKRFRTSYLIAASLVAILLSVVVASSFYWRSRKATVIANVNGPRTIAILPFRSVVAADRDEAWELGIAEQLITRLSNKMIVRPLSSVLYFNAPDQDPLEAGKTLNVELVLDSSYQRSDDRLLVNFRLLKVGDGTVVSSDTVTARSTDMFDLQNEIATKIASTLALKLTTDATTFAKRYTNNAEALDYYNTARYNELKITEEGLRQAIVFYKKAVNADPRFALAYAHMADAYRRLFVTGFDRQDDVAQQNIRTLAAKAFELDDSLPEAHIQLAYADQIAENRISAESNFRKAIALGPYDSEAHIGFAYLLLKTGRQEDAINEARLARELAPRTPIVLALESQILLEAGHADEAILHAKKTLDFEPNFWVAHFHLGRAYASQMRNAEAIEEFEKARQLAPGSRLTQMELAYAYAQVGNSEKTFDTLDQMKRRFEGEKILFVHLARIYNALGQKNKALDLLEEALEAHEKLQGIKQGKRWDNLRSEPRFIDLLRRMETTKRVS
jgi:DNA-binding winged helix-turn-helix (wHTH) protein/TolB-like protein